MAKMSHQRTFDWHFIIIEKKYLFRFRSFCVPMPTDGEDVCHEQYVLTTRFVNEKKNNRIYNIPVQTNNTTIITPGGKLERHLCEHVDLDWCLFFISSALCGVKRHSILVYTCLKRLEN